MLLKKTLIDEKESKLWVIENFSTNHLREMKTLTLEEEPPIRVRGEMKRQRRNVGFYSDESEGYRYSNQIIRSQPLEGLVFLKNLLEKVNTELGTEFNGILVNHYKNGEKYISAHSDDESELDRKNSMVACISFGAVRKFRIRTLPKKKKVLDYLHKPLTLLVMEGKFQKNFTHEIPKEKRVKEERYSLTFRRHLNKHVPVKNGERGHRRKESPICVSS